MDHTPQPPRQQLIQEQRRKPMTPVRACQVARQLLHRLETFALLPDHSKPLLVIGQEELDSIHVLIHATAKAACGFRDRKTS